MERSASSILPVGPKLRSETGADSPGVLGKEGTTISRRSDHQTKSPLPSSPTERIVLEFGGLAMSVAQTL